MGLAAVALHWTATEFWNSTAHEFFAGYEQWNELLPILSGGS